MAPPSVSKWLPKYCVVHILEVNKARDLIFGTVTPYVILNKILQSGHKVAPPLQMAPPTLQKIVLAISRRLIKLGT